MGGLPHGAKEQDELDAVDDHREALDEIELVETIREFPTTNDFEIFWD